MKKSVNEMLKVFNENPVEAKKVFWKKNKNWYLHDTNEFWNRAMSAYPDDNLKATANQLIDYLYENDLIDFDCIASDFLCFYKDNCGEDVGLKTFTIDYIIDCYNEWLEEEDDEELLEAIEKAEGVWYWDRLLKYCVEQKDREYEFAYRVAMAF